MVIVNRGDRDTVDPFRQEGIEDVFGQNIACGLDGNLRHPRAIFGFECIKSGIEQFFAHAIDEELAASHDK